MASNITAAEGTTNVMSNNGNYISSMQVEYQPSDGFILAALLLPSSTTATTVCAPQQQQAPVAEEECKLDDGCKTEQAKGTDAGNDPGIDQMRHCGAPVDCSADSNEGNAMKNETGTNDSENDSTSCYQGAAGGFSILRHLLENGKRSHTYQRLEPPCFEYFRRQQSQCTSTRMFQTMHANHGAYVYDHNQNAMACAFNYGNNSIGCPFLPSEHSGAWNFIQGTPQMRQEYLVNSQQYQPQEARRGWQFLRGRERNANGRMVSVDEVDLELHSSSANESDDDDEDRPLIIDEGPTAQDDDQWSSQMDYHTNQVEPLNLSCR